MWILSRRPGEKLVLPALHVTLTVLEVRGGRVRLGIAAPADTPVHRLEVCHRAAQAGPAPPAWDMIETHTATEGCQESRALELAKQWYARLTADDRREFIVWMMDGAPHLLQAASNPDSRPPADVGGRS